MTMSKIYSNKALFEVFSDIVTRADGRLTAPDVKEAIRIRKRGINVDSVKRLLSLEDATLKAILDTVYIAEEVAEKTVEVPKLCDL